MIATTLTRALKIEHPIFQAPMGGGATTVDLIVETSKAGAMGFIAAAYLSPQEIRRQAKEIHARTDRPFGINLFAPVRDEPIVTDPTPSLQALRLLHSEMGIPRPEIPSSHRLPFQEQFAAALDTGAAAFSFTFGIPEPSVLDAARRCGMFLMGTATTITEAVALEQAGVDAIIAQGSEAGAHRATFLGSFEESLVGSIVLTPQIVDVTSLPVIASGGIMDGRGIAAALALGAQTIQIGTAFLTCQEAGIPECYKEALLSPQTTRITRAFSGRPARGIPNRFMNLFDDELSAAILPYPLQNTLTRPLRNASAQLNNPDFLSLWAGQGVGMGRRCSVAELVEMLVSQTTDAIKQLRRCLNNAPLRLGYRRL